ncbi:MAG: site-specific integrase [Deltaproteobacteria bacterium]|nr:site-specific integrase [Deltaproteobacteria bacterium]
MASLTKIGKQYRLRYYLYLPNSTTIERSRRFVKKGLALELKSIATIAESRTKRQEYTSSDIDFWLREELIGQADAEALQLKKDGKKTLQQAADEYESTWGGISKGEKAARTGRVHRIVDLLGADTPIDQITYLDGEKLKAQLLGLQTKKHPNAKLAQPLKAVTVNKHLQDLKRIFKIQLAQQSITHYPFTILDGAKPKPSEKIKPTVIDADQIATILTEAGKQDQLKRGPLGGNLSLYLYMLFGTGCRRGEAIAARLENINWQNRTLKLVDTKNGHERTLGLGTKLYDILLPKKGQEGPILPPYDKDNISRCVRRHFTRCGIDMRLHDTRHTYTTMLLNTGIEKRHAKGRTGHLDDRMLDHYDHPENQNEIFEDQFEFMQKDNTGGN